ncbi:MAG: flagellar biosynthesis anti-sigma factor FlgM [Nitrospinae bacterium]|nr:flagellar biosynthesis anti-sigma factor FlgM [Nitrospinota bacterium]
MVINRITGGKPQEVRQNEKADRSRESVRGDVAKKSAEGATPEKTTVTAQVSERSQAAIKAYRLAMESKPDIGRVSRLAQIKTQIANGTYRQPVASDVATAILNDVAKDV